MPPAPRARRISYVLAPPTYTVPRLVLPKLGADRHGSTIPLLIPATHEGDKESLVGSLNASNSGNSSSNNDKNGSTAAPSVVVVEHPQHRLGISSLALDTTTRLSGNITPEGILYSGGRDGQVIAHELGAPLKQRTKPYGVNADGKGINRMSDDGRYILTGSADASIKLWSMASANRCIHTFAHHTESVWSLFSSHPSLSVFYYGDRAGNVCRVDMVGCATLSEGECALLCKEERSSNSIGNEGINKIQVLDDQFVWTATASSTINCYKVPGARSTRIAELVPSPDDTDHETLPVAPVPFMGAATSLGFTMDSMHPSALWSRHRDSFSADREGWIRSESPSSISSPFGASNRSIAKSTSLEHAASQDPSESSIFARTVQTPPGIAHNPATSSAFGIAYRSLIKLSSPVDFASAPFNRNRDPDVSTLYSAASIKSVPVPIRSFTMRTLQQKEQAPRPSNPPQPQQLRSVMRRSMASIEGISF
ncbi:hypothetical protein FRB91_002351, partial [Serendipita sp. 411]